MYENQEEPNGRFSRHSHPRFSRSRRQDCHAGLGAGGWNRGLSRRFDAVVSDSTMPGRTGLDLAGRMLQVRAELRIIFSTGYGNLVNEEQVKMFGIRDLSNDPKRECHAPQECAG